MSARCAFATASAVAPWTSWMSMYIGMSISGKGGVDMTGRSARRFPVAPLSGPGHVTGNGHGRRLAQRLIDDAVALGQAHERAQLIFGGIGIQVEGETDALKADGGVLDHTERAAKIEIAF